MGEMKMGLMYIVGAVGAARGIACPHGHPRPRAVRSELRHPIILGVGCGVGVESIGICPSNPVIHRSGHQDILVRPDRAVERVIG